MFRPAVNVSVHCIHFVETAKSSEILTRSSSTPFGPLSDPRLALSLGQAMLSSWASGVASTGFKDATLDML